MSRVRPAPGDVLGAVIGVGDKSEGWKMQGPPQANALSGLNWIHDSDAGAK